MSGIALPRRYGADELVRLFGGSIDPRAEDAEVARIVAPEAAEAADDLVVLTSSRYLTRVEKAPGLLLCSTELAPRIGLRRRWQHSHVMWVVAELLGPLEPSRDKMISDHSFVEPGAELAADVRVAPGATILSGARLAGGCDVRAGAVICGGVRLGARVCVGENSVIGRAGFGFTAAPDGSLRRVPQLGGVEIDDDVEIGPLCTIDAGTLGPTRIGRGAKLDAHVHVGHNVSIGAGCFVAAQSGFAGSSRIGNGVLVGGQAGVTDHVRIGDMARISAKAGVIGDVPQGATVAGFPAVPRWRWLRAVAASMQAAKVQWRR